MGDEQSKALWLAEKVSDGTEIDWEEVERHANDARELAMVARLRQIADLAEVHRSQPSTGDSMRSDGITTVSVSTKNVMKPEAQNKGGTLATWGRLELLDKLGEGGYGEVYLAWDKRLERRVALKLLRARPDNDESFSSSVIEEGRLLARVKHPNVVTVHGAEEHDGRVGIWMEYVRGRTLEELLQQQGPMNDREAAMVGADLCRALAAVHGAGLLHRDIKTQNAMRAAGGRIVLMDFGAGRDVNRDEEATETITGTALYMAPEVVQGETATPLSDIYSLGVLLYHFVTGAFPVEAISWQNLKERHRRREARLLRDQRSDLPEPFVKTVEKALSWDPEDRYATAGQMEQALQAVFGSDTPRKIQDPAEEDAKTRRAAFQPRRLLAVAALIVMGVVGAWYVFDQLRRPESGIVDTRQYSVEAALYRVDSHGRRERLEQGASLALGDALSLEFKASTSVHLYVVNEDEEGHAYALFPLPDLDLKNPLQAGVTHRIPGHRQGKPISWTVDTSGGREHLLVLASPERQIEFEAEMGSLARPSLDGSPSQAVPLSKGARETLRGLGGLVETPGHNVGGKTRHLFDLAKRLASRTEVVEGVWLRQIAFDNSAHNREGRSPDPVEKQ